MNSFLLRADEVLRGGAQLTQAAQPWRALRPLIACVVVFGFLYGGVMGTFGGIGDGRMWQVIYSAVKVPLLLLAAFGLSLPSFFVLNTLAGLRSDFAHALRALLATQAALAIILAALAPFTLLWYASSASYRAAILFNAVMFAVASLSAQGLLRRHYRALIARDERHRWLLRLWLLLYGFVGIQMGWMLRPFVGEPDMPTHFFRADTWGNAYIILAHMIWKVLAS